MRSLAVCPACGRRIVGEEGVRVRGERYHRTCADYPGQRAESSDAGDRKTDLLVDELRQAVGEETVERARPGGGGSGQGL